MHVMGMTRTPTNDTSETTLRISARAGTCLAIIPMTDSNPARALDLGARADANDNASAEAIIPAHILAQAIPLRRKECRNFGNPHAWGARP
jgi:hypothetical protein